MSDEQDSGVRFGIVCNVQEGSSFVRPNALCWVCRRMDGNVRVRVRSRGGRWVVTHFADWKLCNFRPKWLPPTTSKWRDEVAYLSREAAETDAIRFDKAARDERSRRNVCEIERMAGHMDACGRREEKP